MTAVPLKHSYKHLRLNAYFVFCVPATSCALNTANSTHHLLLETEIEVSVSEKKCAVVYRNPGYEQMMDIIGLYCETERNVNK